MARRLSTTERDPATAHPSEANGGEERPEAPETSQSADSSTSSSRTLDRLFNLVDPEKGADRSALGSQGPHHEEGADVPDSQNQSTRDPQTASASPTTTTAPWGLRTAQLNREHGQLWARLPGGPDQAFVVRPAPGVDLDFIEEMSNDGYVALVEITPTTQSPATQERAAEGSPTHSSEAPAAEALVVGILQTRAPHTAKFQAQELSFEGVKQITLRSGRAALRLSSDGSLELLGTRISAASRGVLRLVGRALRLN